MVTSSPLPPKDRLLTMALVLPLPAAVVALALDIPQALWISVAAAPLFLFSVINYFLIGRPFFPYDRILSAVSPDGTTWRKEAGVRLDVGGRHRSVQVYFPTVLKDSQGWRMFYRAGSRRSVIASALSKDGLLWSEEEGMRIGLGGTHGLRRLDSPWGLQIGDGSWRLYYAGFDGCSWRVFCRDSGDGIHWLNERVCLDFSDAQDLPHVKSPSVIAVDGGYRVVAMRFVERRVVFYTAFSVDGMEWEDGDYCTGLESTDHLIRNPSVIRLPNSGFRMYYSEYPLHPIGARLASAVSTDGLHWQRDERPALEPGGNFDRHGLFSCTSVPLPAGWRMYYSGYWGKHWLEPYTLMRKRGRRGKVLR